MILPTLEGISTDWKGKDEEKLEGKERKKIKELNTKYRVKKKGITPVIEELKQKLIAKKTKVKRYEQKISQFRQNQLFQANQQPAALLKCVCVCGGG